MLVGVGFNVSYRAINKLKHSSFGQQYAISIQLLLVLEWTGVWIAEILLLQTGHWFGKEFTLTEFRSS